MSLDLKEERELQDLSSNGSAFQTEGAAIVFWAFIDFKLNASKIEKMGTGRLEAIVGPYGLPNGLDRCGIFHNGIT